MAVTAVPGVVNRPIPRLRRMEDERWLALALLAPTAILLGLFIAYPFFEGVLLSMTNTRVGIDGHVGQYGSVAAGRHPASIDEHALAPTRHF